MRISRHITLIICVLAACRPDPRTTAEETGPPPDGFGASQDLRRPADLLITNASVLDVRTGVVLPDQTIVIRAGWIVSVQGAGQLVPPIGQTIDAAGHLVTPGLIDVHGHSANVLGDSISDGGGAITHLSSAPDSLRAYQRRYAEAYLPYGVTTVRDVGTADSDLPILLSWPRHSPELPDVYLSGGLLVSVALGRVPFPGYTVVVDSAEAVAAVRRYYDFGINNIKFHSRLGDRELRSAFGEATRLGMKVSGHIDGQVVGIERTLALGLRNFEHAHTIAVSAMTPEEYSAMVPAVRARYGNRSGGLFLLLVTEYFNQMGRENSAILELIDLLATTGSQVTPTLHVYAHGLGLASYRADPQGDFDDMAGLTPDQLERARGGYQILAGYVARMHATGVRLAVGTDWYEPGRASLSEMELLQRAGLSMAEVFRAATLGGAEAIGIASTTGTIEPGRRANLVIWNANPLDDPQNLWAGLTVIKDGVPLGMNFTPSASN